MLYSTAADTFSLVTSTAAGRALLDDADAAAQRTTLGLVIGTNVFTQRTLTGTANEITITNGDGVSAAPTFSIPTALTFTGKTVTGGTFSGPTLSGTVAGAATWSGIQTLQQQVNIGSGVASGGVALHIDNSTVTNNKMGAYFQGAGTAFAFVPYDSGSYSTSDEFGYDFTSNVWFFDSATVNLAGSPIVSRSATETLTNKTLSSPTLSGTVAGSPTLSGSLTFAGGHQRITQVSTGTSPAASGSSLTDIILRVGASNVGSAGYGLDVGTSNATGQVWMQARDWSSYATNVAINLNPNGGGVTLGGVAIPTISSTDTLSNKTLSSPTLSGTVAGSPTFSGNLTFTGTTSITISTTEPRLDFYETNAGTNAKLWSIINDGGSFGLQTRTDADVFGQTAISIARSGTTVGTIALSGTALTFGGVAIPTISSTDTLSNKTLSSPTLSGTVSGTPTFSGSPFKIGDGTDTVAMTGTSPQLKVQGASFSTGITVRRDGNAEVGMQSTGRGNIGTWTNHAVNLYVNAANRIEFDTSLMTLNDAYDIAVGTTTGTKIGTATTQKLGFFNKTPVVQPTAVADATDAASVITQLNALLTRMRNLGLIAT